MHTRSMRMHKRTSLGKPQRAVERLATASAGAPAHPTTPAVEPHPLAAMATSLLLREKQINQSRAKRMEEPMTGKEISEAIGRLAKGKSPGPDHLPYTFQQNSIRTSSTWWPHPS